MKNICGLWLGGLLLFPFLVSGCAIVVIGAAGVAGGYAISPDGIEGISDKSYDQVWSRAEDVLKQQGSIQWSDKKAGKMQAKIGSSVVWFKMEQAIQHSVVVRVQARKMGGMFPDMSLARRIYSMIMKEQEQA